MVILADESGSIAQTPNAIAGERQAAIEIIQAAWSPSSQVAVYGFGSAPPVRGASASEAVDELCGLTELNTAANLSTLAHCADLIAPRTKPGEDNTDFAAALTQAETVLSAPDPVHRVPLVFILTDGKLDVGANSPYLPRPSTATQGYRAAQQQITGTILPSLRQFGAEVWPLGFGQADQHELDTFARGGAQLNRYCPADANAVPRLTVVPSTVTGTSETQQIEVGLLGAFAAATCGTINPGRWQTIPPGASVSVPVTIDPLTALGSIVVNKGSPRVEVTYTDPDGGKISDSPTKSGSSSIHSNSYALDTGGSQSTLEALRLQGPLPGPWKVTFTNNSPIAQTVGVSVVWQGQVEPEIKLFPQIGDSGKPLSIRVEPAIDSAPIPASELAKLTASVTVQWTGASSAVHKAAKLDPATGDFVTSVPVPADQSGVATITATVQERGVQGTAVAKLSYQPGGGMRVDLNIPTGIRVSPGGSLTETATVDNQGEPATSIEFLLANLGDGVDAHIANPSGPVRIDSGRDTFRVTIKFGSDSRHGPASGTIRWRVVGSDIENTAAYLNVNIAPRPTPIYEQWWLWTAIVLVLAGLGALPYMRKRRRTARVAAAEIERQRKNMDLQNAGLALIPRRDDPAAGGPNKLWTKGYIAERWFSVERRPGHSPVLHETTDVGTGLLRLTRDPDKGDYIVACPAAEAEPAVAEPAVAGWQELRVPQLDAPFDPPDDAGLTDCQLVLVTTGEHYYTPPPSRDTDEGIKVSQRLSQPEPFKVDKFRSGDVSATEQKGA